MAENSTEKKPKKQKKLKAKISIGAKLTILISVLMLLALTSITVIVSHFVREDEKTNAESNNFAINSRSATNAENEIAAVKNNSFLLIDLISSYGKNSAQANYTTELFFKRNPNIMSITVSDSLNLFNSKFISDKEIPESAVYDFIINSQERINLTKEGAVHLANASPSFSPNQMLALFYPIHHNGEMRSAIIIFATDAISESFGVSATNHTYLLNEEGDILIDSDTEKVLKGENLRDNPIIKAVQESTSNNMQFTYPDSTKENLINKLLGIFEIEKIKLWDNKVLSNYEYDFIAFHKLTTGNAIVITTVGSQKVFKAVNATTRRNIYITIGVLFFSIIFVFLFSKFISNPIKALSMAANDIENGDYNVPVVTKAHDEIGILNTSFINMGKGLAERERLKDAFGKFTNKAVAEKAARGELTLGGEKKNATIFFSDIRSFTAMSEKMQPEEVISFLNDYMTRMVSCVLKTGGVVDKFIGDAVMAVWGAPLTSGDPREDALNCVRTAFLMRASLLIFNKERAAKGLPNVRIGCGINSGPVVAGQMGSKQKMEYTVLGDAVNFASRTESLNKPLGTDILITENTYELIKDKITVEEMPGVTVKGKTGLCRMFAVINMPEETEIPGAGPNGPQTLQQIRAKLGIPEPDISAVNLDEEEKKYKIFTESKKTAPGE